jgi:NAD-dependent deacetylase
MKKKIVVLTGAGISAESGLRTFRDSDGLWEEHRIEDVATPMAWARDQELVLKFYNQRRKDVQEALPNAAHIALAELQNHFAVTIITQNIDDLHERAGSKDIIHLHGEILKSRSSKNPALLYECTDDIKTGDLAADDSQLRPHVVWFHEAVPMMDIAAARTAEADIFLVIGTSLQVYPAAGLIHYAPVEAPKFLVDPMGAPLADIDNLTVMQAKATTGVPLLVKELIREFAI